MRDKINGIIYNFYPHLLAFLVFTVPVNYRFTLYTLGVSFVLAVYMIVKDGCFNDILKNRLVVGVVMLWLFFAFSLTYTSNLRYGLNDIFQKISMVFLPLVLIPIARKPGNKSSLVKNSFLFGILVSSLFFIARAFVNSTLITPVGIFFKPNPVGVPWENYFFYERFVSPHHPTYYSMYLALGIVFIAEKIKHLSRLKVKVYFYLFWLYLLVVTYFTSSKIGIVLSIIISFLLLVWVLKRKGKIVITTFFAIFIVLGVFLIHNNYRLRSSINNVAKYLNGSRVDDEIAKQGLVRFEIWRVFPKVFDDNSLLFGTGIGDVKKELVAVYDKNNIKYARDVQLNAHNQYIQTLVSVGVIGLGILLSILGYAFWLAYRKRDMVLFLFLIIISVNFMFESVLERVFGVIFFVFFLLFLSSKSEAKIASIDS